MTSGEGSAGRGVDHHRGITGVEPAGPDERDLAAAAFLRGRADRGELPRQLIYDRPHADRSRDADHRDEVVAAGVPDLGERVVLLEDRDRRSGRPALRVPAIAGFDPPVAALDTEAGALKELGDPQRGLALLVRELRLGVYRARECKQRIAPLVDRLDRALRQRLRIAHA